MNTSQGSFGRAFLQNRKKHFSLLAVLFLSVVLLFIVALFLGSTEINFKYCFSAFSTGEYTDPNFRIFSFIRLPRALAALLSGGALAVSGVLIQALLSNPMAAPNIIGVNSGAGLSATVIIALFPNALVFLPIAAFFGALFTCILIYSISIKTNASRLTITLVGIAVGSVLNAIINTIKVFSPDSVYDTDLYMIGGFSGATYGKLVPAGILIFIALMFAVLLSRDIDVLSLGAAQAASLGLNVPFKRLILMIIASALAGAAVSFAGLLGFVGLLVPHIIRRFIGNRHKILIIGSSLLGSALVLACDIISRVAFAPYEIPVGILLSIVGGIFFICLVLFGRKGETL